MTLNFGNILKNIFTHASNYNEGLGYERIQDINSRWGCARITSNSLTILKTISLPEWNRNDLVEIEGTVTMQAQGVANNRLQFSFEGASINNNSSFYIDFNRDSYFKLMIQRSYNNASGEDRFGYSLFLTKVDNNGSVGSVSEIDLSGTPDKTGLNILIKGLNNTDSTASTYSWNVKWFKETKEDI